jgi:hypothetical protein
MGGHPYQYVVDDKEDLQEALNLLRPDVFRENGVRTKVVFAGYSFD